MRTICVCLLIGVVTTPAVLAIDLRPGDMNCDGRVDFGDIDGFTLAILGRPVYEAAEPTCNHLNADCNFDGIVNFDDIDQFVSFVISGPVTPIQLAGRTIPQYPFFEFTQAIHNNLSVQAAVDPGRVGLSGPASARLYVVASRSRAEWAANPVLTDVRGGHQSVTLGGATIQENVFTLSGPGGLASDGGLSLGRGYDVVLDMNSNGLLDGGDFIDGRGDEAGFYYVPNTTVSGPLAVTSVNYTVTGISSGLNNQRLFYPTNIAALGPLPLVIIGHGNGHNYQWYDYLQSHLASWGYIVMSHANNTGPGPTSAAVTTLEHTQAILAQQATIAGGVLNNRIQTDNIMWVGHSRGGEGVVIAYSRLINGTFTSPQYDATNIRVVSSISPTDFQGLSGSPQANPHGVIFHLLYGSSDGDVQGAPGTGSKPFAIYERATGPRQSTYLQGVGHNEFNCCGFADATGPDLIGRPAAQTIARGYYLPLVQHYLSGNVPSRDFFTRLYREFKPQGVLASAIVVTEYRDALARANRRVDDYQSQTSTAVSSSGGAVSFSVSNVVEAQMIDTDGSFAFTSGVPMNGMTRSKDAADTPRGVVFDWTTPTFYELQVAPGQRNLRGFEHISLRACQGTRHPNTDALNAPLHFTVTLRDGAGVSSSINFNSYGGISRTYLRTGAGGGAGWGNEFNSVRLRLTDFLTNGSGLNLGDIVAVRLEFGGAFGSDRGRLGLDDVEFTLD